METNLSTDLSSSRHNNPLLTKKKEDGEEEEIVFRDDQNANENATGYFSIPPPSFYTVEELYLHSRDFAQTLYSEPRGTTCCISIHVPKSYLSEASVEIPNTDQSDLVELYVGLSHQKAEDFTESVRQTHNMTFTVRQYTYNFYAFVPTPPFRTVALSGNFCLGHASETEIRQGQTNPLVNLTNAFSVTMDQDVMNCPFITFISGMVESIGNPDRVVLAYGINDCTSRFVEVEKSEIVRMLFHPFVRFEM